MMTYITIAADVDLHLSDKAGEYDYVVTYTNAASRPRPTKEYRLSIRRIWATTSRASIIIAHVILTLCVDSIVQGVKTSATNLAISKKVHIVATIENKILVDCQLTLRQSSPRKSTQVGRLTQFLVWLALLHFQCL